MLKKKFEKLSYKLGFTLTESTVISFLAIVFLLGTCIKYVFSEEKKSVLTKYNYSKEDSLFYASDSIKLGKLTEKKVDNEAELLDFSKDKFFYKENSNFVLKEKSIDLNKADKNLLIKLPGIGTKTAEAIIDFRNKNKQFHKIDDLMKVKGIGKTKFNKIRKFIIIE
ncbi:MAG: helix-hairpin-helix domain-containing protein [Melioribacteraceae bacterium]|nr:helix-hairpin-helix domain-containing protein [Melioribacteraceae bacterium]